MKRHKILLLILAVLVGSILLSGCVERRPVVFVGVPISLTQQDVIDMAKKGATEAEIIAEIEDTQSIFVLNTKDIEKLKEEGVPEAVIDHMLTTRERPPRVIERYRIVEEPVYVYRPYYRPRVTFHFGYYYHSIRHRHYPRRYYIRH